MAKRPHIIIFNPDQWRSDVMGHLGNPAAHTPNLDNLIQNDAVSFGQAFCQNPVCTPSRCSFMTGWYPHVNGHRTMYHMLRSHEPMMLQILRDHGYHVWWGGKNDLVPGQNKWSDYCDVHHQPQKCLPNYAYDKVDQWRGTPDDDSYYSFYVGKIDKGDQPYYRDSDWAHVEAAIETIENHNDEKPLCIYLPLIYPHPPYGVEDPWFSVLDRDKIPPRPIADDLASKASILSAIAQRQNLRNWSEQRWQELRAAYYGMCARLDHQFNLIVQALQKKGIYDDTAMFLFSDHGDYTGDYGIVEKTQNTFEDCLSRVPLIIKPPADIPLKPGVSSALVELIDVSATIYDFVDIDPGYWSFGKSLRSVLTGSTDQHRDAVFCEGGRLKAETHAMEKQSTSFDNPQGLYYPRISAQQHDDPCYHTKAAMCRTHDFKYIHRLYEHDELYDLKRDPHETKNLINNPDYQDTLYTLRQRLLQWYMETADVVPLTPDQRSFTQ